MLFLKICGIVLALLLGVCSAAKLVAYKTKPLLWLCGMFVSALAVGLLLRTF